MTIAPKLRQYLVEREASFDCIAHQPTRSALQTAIASSIPAQQLAKAVLIETQDDQPLLVVVPADRRVVLDELSDTLGSKPHLAPKKRVTMIFDDCAVGAVPPLGEGYGVETLVDDCLGREPDVYFEAGDRVSLIHVDRSEFARLTRSNRHGRFSDRWSETG